jgi:hypothetical protein
VLNVVLLYRRIEAIGTLTVSLWIGTLLTTTAVIVSGALHFDAARAFDFPPGAFDFSIGFLLGLGAAARVGIYDYLGYYDVCYIGDEVKDPGRVIPRSILISIIAVAAIYLAINLSIIGVVPWREFVPADAHPESEFIVSTFMERLYGTRGATVFTFLILWTAFGSVFALLLGYSRIRYAAARDGYFFHVFSRLHPTGRFPHVSLLLLGAISIVCSFLPLGLVIDALITTRILVQLSARCSRSCSCARSDLTCPDRFACGSIRFPPWSRWPDGSSFFSHRAGASSRSVSAHSSSESCASSFGRGMWAAGHFSIRIQCRRRCHEEVRHLRDRSVRRPLHGRGAVRAASVAATNGRAVHRRQAQYHRVRRAPR